jgi:general secretion pathway protein M
MTGVPPWAGRAAALLLLVALIGLIAAVGILPVASYSARLEAEIEQNLDLVSRLERLTAAREDYEAQIEILNAERGEESVYLEGQSEGVAAANLQKLIGAVVDAHGGDLKSTQSLQARREGDFERVAVRIVLEATVTTLFEVLLDLETSTPYVFIESFDARTQRRRTNQDQPEEDPLLVVRFDLFGYLKGQAG